MIISKQCVNCSFDVVATQFYEWLRKNTDDVILQKIGCNADIEFIDVNLWWTQCQPIDDLESPNSVVRGDSPYLYLNPDEIQERSRHVLIVPSEYNKRMFEKFFHHVEVIPHAYDPHELEVIRSVKEKKYDVITIGYNTKDDHKGLTTARRVAKELNLRYVEVSNECDGRDNCIQFMSLPRDELYRLIAQSRFYLALSHTEGFGLPVLEAMVAGTIPIFVDGHAFHEYAQGVRIPVQEVKGKFWYDYEYKDVVEAVRYAVSMKKEEYDDLSERVRKKAIVDFDPSLVYSRLLESFSLQLS